MAIEAKRPAKTEILSMRMDTKIRFLLEALAKLRGQSITTVVERAILEVADHADFGHNKTWRDYWHVSDGVRALKLAAAENLYPTYEDECKLAFARTHWPFFYMTSACTTHRVSYINIIWPRIEEMFGLWEMTKATDYFAAGKAMQRALEAADIAPPDWPIKPEKPKPVAPSQNGGPSWDAPKGGDLDDEIPF
jgi:hypothetical protein